MTPLNRQEYGRPIAIDIDGGKSEKRKNILSRWPRITLAISAALTGLSLAGARDALAQDDGGKEHKPTQTPASVAELTEPISPDDVEPPIEVTENTWANADWTQATPEQLMAGGLAPELVEALQNPDYMQLGYLTNGASGEFVGIPIVFNPYGTELRKNKALNKAKRYFLMHTPETPAVVTEKIIPFIVEMHRIENFGSPVPPQIVINQYTWEERNRMPGENVWHQGYFVSREYNPETNVLTVNLALTIDYSIWAGDIVQIIQGGITAACTKQRDHYLEDQYFWDVLVNPVTNGKGGVSILASEGDVNYATEAGLTFKYPVTIAS